MNLRNPDCESSFITHHGILGMKWGVRRYQNKDGSLTPAGILRYGKKNLKQSMTVNLDKFGKDADHNVLYVTGLSKSGKSTLALSIKKESDEFLYLDTYTNQMGFAHYHNKDFNNFLEVKHPDLIKKIDWDTNRKLSRQEYFENVDTFAKAIEEYGADCFSKGKRVIAEGVQIYNRFLREDSSFYKDKPVIITTTDWKKSLSRKMNSGTTPKGQKPFWTKHYLNASSQLTEFEKQVLAEKGKQEVLKFLRERE